MIAINYLECSCCDGYGYVTEETTGNHEPYAQNVIDLQCEDCNGKGQIIDLEEMISRTEEKHGYEYQNELAFIADAEELLSGMQKRKEMVLFSINALQQMGLQSELFARWQDRMNTINRGIDRIKKYKQILSTYETNI
jgi:DnaJ-class molecular chaperone